MAQLPLHQQQVGGVIVDQGYAQGWRRQNEWCVGLLSRGIDSDLAYRHGQCHLSAEAGLRLQRNSTAHLFDNLFTDRQPQPGPLNGYALCTACAIERLEQFIYLIGGDTTAAVGHRQPQFPLRWNLLMPTDIHLNSAVWRELNCIVYQIVSHLK
ncbi:hypothetical protein D3C81_1523820 [compost metagenome]